MTVDGLEFLASLPDLPTDERDERIYEAIIAGHAPKIVWSAIDVEHKGLRGKVFVATRSFEVGDTNPVLVNMSQLTFQRLTDRLRDDGTFGPEPVYEALTPTSKVSDAAYTAADVKLGPHLQPPASSVRVAKGYSRRMDDTGAMLRHHQDVAGEMCALGVTSRDALVGPMGKCYHAPRALQYSPKKCAEYGLYALDAIFRAVTYGIKLWQGAPGMVHVARFKDYSMCPWAMRAKMLIFDALGDSRWVDVRTVAADPEMCWLVSAEGVLKSLRHPAIPGPEGEAAPPLERPRPLFNRTLRLMNPMMVGQDVLLVQGVVGAAQDMVFGPGTKALVVEWQRKHGLAADGVVGRRTRKMMAKELGAAHVVAKEVVGSLPHEPNLDQVAFVAAANYTRVPGTRTVRLVVAHAMQAPEKPSTAESVADWFGGRAGEPPRSSAHLCGDNDSVVECVKPNDVAWACPGMNHDGYHVEHSGFAQQTRAEWLDPYSESMLWLTAQAVRHRVVDPYSIPVRRLTNAQLRAGEKGFVDHKQGSDVYKKSTHHDVGDGFPWDVWLEMVRDAA